MSVVIAFPYQNALVSRGIGLKPNSCHNGNLEILKKNGMVFQIFFTTSKKKNRMVR